MTLQWVKGLFSICLIAGLVKVAMAGFAIGLGFAALVANNVHAGVSMPFDCKYLVEEANVVSKVKVVDVTEEQVSMEVQFEPVLKLQPPPKITRYRAQLETLSQLKGSSPKQIEVTYPKSGPNGPGYTELYRSEVCVVFLKGKTSPYFFADPNNGKMEVLPNEIRYRFGDTPQDKLFAELLASAEAEVGSNQIHAIEQLGYLGDLRAALLLKRFSASSDIVLRGKALISRVQIGDTPTVEELIAFLKRSPNEFSRESSLKKHRTSGYSVPSLQTKLLSKIEHSVKRPYMDRPAQRLKNFDYHEFYRQVSQCEIFSLNDEGTQTEFPRRSMERTLRALKEQANRTPTVRPASHPSKP